MQRLAFNENAQFGSPTDARVGLQRLRLFSLFLAILGKLKPFLREDFAGAIAKLIFIASLINAMNATEASAQSKQGWLGWVSPHSPEYFATPDAACRSQWQYYNGTTNSRYIGAILNPGGIRGGCSWTQFQYLCPQETGGDASSCGLIFPTWVELRCGDGYVPRSGQCLNGKDLIPERPCECNNGGAENRQVAHPIVLSSGAKVLHVTDYASADGKFTIGRFYRSMPFGLSLNYIDPPLGLAGGWSLDFAYELQLAAFSGSPSSPNAYVTVVAPDGTAYDFVLQTDGTFAAVSDPDIRPFYAPTDLKLEYLGTLPSDLSTLQSASSQWRLTDRNDTVWTFQTVPRPNTSTYSIGRPVSRLERGGYRWDFSYRSDNSLQTISDSFGRRATFNWSLFYVTTLANPPSGSLPWPEVASSVSLPDGSALRYTYDPPPDASAPSIATDKRLTKVERLNASAVVIDSTSYTYADTRFPHAITAITDFDGVQTASYAYDSNGRAISSALGNNFDAYTVSYTENYPQLTRTVTTPLGKVEDYQYQHYDNGIASSDIRLASVSNHASTNTAASINSITYGTDNFIATTTDDNGNVTSYTRDSKGHPITIVEASGTPQARTTTINWDSAYNLPDQIIRPGLQINYTYSTSGQPLTRTETDATTQSTPYSTAGQARTWTYSWDSNGRLLSVNGPKPVNSLGQDDVTTFVYDASGNLLTATNGLGQVTTFASYDVNGRPGTMTDPNGIVTAYTYDQLGRTVTVTVKHPTDSSQDAVTAIDYDSDGRIVGITPPATDKLIMDYNSGGQLTDIHVASGERIDFQNDAMGNVLSQTIKRADGSSSRSIARTFDELGRMLTQTLGPDRTTSWSYDKNGNPTQLVSPRNFATQAAFDPLNRIVSKVAPDTGTAALAYDANDRITSHTDAKSVQTSFVRDGFGDVIQESSPDRGTSTYYYNEAGELTAGIDGRGQRIDYTRDILGRLTQKTPAGRPASETVTYTWDSAGVPGSFGVGRLSSVTDTTGTTSFGYDHRGNLITKRQSIAGATADLAYAYDLGNRITQIAYPSGRVVAYDRDSKGRVAGVRTKSSASDPSWTALASSITYEPWGSMTGAQFGNGLSLGQSWTDGRLISKQLFNTTSGTSLSSLAYTYDLNDNVASVRDLLNDANSVYYGYDPNDRLTFASMTAANPTLTQATFNYTTGTNQLASLVDGTGTRSITYDGRGNTLSETRPSSISVSTSYDGYGRLLTYDRTGDLAQTNTYNGLDERVSITSGSATHSFVYDADGRLVGEYDSVTGAPIAETIWLSASVANGNEPIGGDDGIDGYAPLAVVTGAGTNAATYWVHGNSLGVPIVTTDQTGAVVTPSAYTVAGFPGQTQTLSDIYYNRYRDYDSSTGRYIQADPIGLEGGTNPFLYARANPLKFTDPSGQNPFFLFAVAVPIAYNLGYQLGQNLAAGHPWDLGCYDLRNDAMIAAMAFGAPETVAEESGPLVNAVFAQTTFRQTFSSAGTFAGRTVEEVAGALRSGEMNAADVPVQYIVRDGNTLILNTRSAQALEQAGIPRSQWNAIDMTGEGAAESRLTGQLQRNGLTSEGITTVRPLNPGGGS